MERCHEEYGYTAQDYFRCYENSIKFDPSNAEAYEAWGYALDVYTSEYEKAEAALRRAIELGAGWQSYYARARVLAEMGKVKCALDSLLERNCLCSERPEIQKLRGEILDGIWGK